MKNIAIVRPSICILTLLYIIIYFLLQEKDVDLLLVDSGDLHDGMYHLAFIETLIKSTFQALGFLMATPLVVSTRTRFVVLLLTYISKLIIFARLQKSNKFLERLPYDVMAIGK
jgi:hypothetical protein